MLKKTPFYEIHKNLNAKMVPFAGYEMPIQYETGMLKEHLAVRERAGLFDVSHMGEFWVTGRDAAKFLSRCTTRDAESLAVGKAQYCLLPNHDGGLIDDIIIYRVDRERFWVVVNASNILPDWQHLVRVSKEFSVELLDVSDSTCLVALQGPLAAAIIKQDYPEAEALKYYHFLTTADGLIVARTGYTGEDGFEVFGPAEPLRSLWGKWQAAGALPIGLGARDTLRLEVGFALYGHELSATLLPQETVSAFAVQKGHACIGSQAFLNAPRYRPIAVQGASPKPLRADETLWINGELAGRITSGSTSPALKLGIGLALVETRFFDSKTFLLESGAKQREVVKVTAPFVETRRVKRRVS